MVRLWGAQVVKEEILMIRTARLGAMLLAVPVLMAMVALPAAAATEREQVGRKLGRGLANMTTGVLEVPGTIHEVTQERGAAWGWTLGFAQGLGNLVVRTMVGCYEFVTAPFALPANYEPIIEPEFAWGRFQDPAPGAVGAGPSSADY